MASDNWKREAWWQAFMARFDVGMAPPAAVQEADGALALLEQREREGRFGPAADEDEWMERAQRAEAEVERLKAVNTQAFERADAECARADKAESLLKEALGQLRHSSGCVRYRSGAPADGCDCGIAALLARARREGVSDGE